MPDRAAAIVTSVQQNLKNDKHRGLKEAKWWNGGFNSYCIISRIVKQRERLAKCFVLIKPIVSETRPLMFENVFMKTCKTVQEAFSPIKDQKSKSTAAGFQKKTLPSTKNMQTSSNGEKTELTLREKIDLIHEQFPTPSIANQLRINLKKADSKQPPPEKKNKPTPNAASSTVVKKKSLSDKIKELHAKYNVSEENQYLLNLVHDSSFRPGSKKTAFESSVGKISSSTKEPSKLEKQAREQKSETECSEANPDYDSDLTTISDASCDEKPSRAGPGSFNLKEDPIGDFCGSKTHLVFEESESGTFKTDEYNH